MMQTRTEQTEVHGCFEVHYEPFKDQRGSFEVSYHEEEFERLGLPRYWPQDNCSFSYAGALRGLHIQSHRPQGKLIRCLKGKVWDVCLDLRRSSPTFLKYTFRILKAKQATALYCPPGTAHGFLALEDSVVHYKCTTLYQPSYDGGVNAKDPDMRIAWPNYPGPLIRSEKDKALPGVLEYLERLG